MFVAIEKETNAKIAEHDCLESLGRIVHFAGWKRDDVKIIYSIEIGLHQSRGPNACLKDFYDGFDSQEEIVSSEKRTKTPAA